MFNRKLNSARRSGRGQADGASIRTEWRSVELAWRARNEGSLRNGSRGDALMATIVGVLAKCHTTSRAWTSRKFITSSAGRRGRADVADERRETAAQVYHERRETAVRSRLDAKLCFQVARELEYNHQVFQLKKL